MLKSDTNMREGRKAAVSFEIPHHRETNASMCEPKAGKKKDVLVHCTTGGNAPLKAFLMEFKLHLYKHQLLLKC